MQSKGALYIRTHLEAHFNCTTDQLNSALQGTMNNGNMKWERTVKVVEVEAVAVIPLVPLSLNA